MDPSKKYVIVELNDGFKVEGVLTDVDKTNFTIHITEATKYRFDEKGNNIPEKLNSSELNISKADIKEVKLVQWDQLSSQKPSINNPIPTQVKSQPIQQIQTNQQYPSSQQIQSNQSPYGSLPQQQNLPANNGIKYEKGGFFDQLGTMNNRDTVRETIRDNEKNKETFNLPDNYNSGSQRGGGYNNNRRGGRGQRRGGGFNNNYTRNNQMYGQQSYNNRETFDNFQQKRGGNKYEGNRGGGYGRGGG